MLACESKSCTFGDRSRRAAERTTRQRARCSSFNARRRAVRNLQPGLPTLAVRLGFTYSSLVATRPLLDQRAARRAVGVRENSGARPTQSAVSLRRKRKSCADSSAVVRRKLCPGPLRQRQSEMMMLRPRAGGASSAELKEMHHGASQWRADLLGPSALVAPSVAWPAGILSPLSQVDGKDPAREPCPVQ